MSPGELIRAQCERRLWTQRQLAARCGITQSRLSAYERGESQLRPLAYALTGRIALRLHGLVCSTPLIEAVVFEQSSVGQHDSDRASTDSTASSDFCAAVADRLGQSNMQVWCPETWCFRHIVSADAVREIVRRSAGQPTFRTRGTMTRLEVTLVAGSGPGRWAHDIGGVAVPVLGLDAIAATADDELAAFLRRSG